MCVPVEVAGVLNSLETVTCCVGPHFAPRSAIARVPLVRALPGDNTRLKTKPVVVVQNGQAHERRSRLLVILTRLVLTDYSIVEKTQLLGDS
jgi:hypothetical protein